MKKKYKGIALPSSAFNNLVLSRFLSMQYNDQERDNTELAVRQLLRWVGEDPEREGLRETPSRVVKAWKEMTVGYGQDPADVLGTDFDIGRYDEMVISPRIEFYSNCEHHMLPFFGVCYAGYLPNRKTLRVVGLSKLSRVVDIFAQRLQVQERLTLQIADAIEEHLKASGVMVVIEAKHFCMCSRGVGKQQASMITSAVRGLMKQPTVRAEFLSLIALNGRH